MFGRWTQHIAREQRKTIPRPAGEYQHGARKKTSLKEARSAHAQVCLRAGIAVASGAEGDLGKPRNLSSGLHAVRGGGLAIPLVKSLNETFETTKLCRARADSCEYRYFIN